MSEGEKKTWWPKRTGRLTFMKEMIVLIFFCFLFKIKSENRNLCWRSFDTNSFKVINNSKEGLPVGKDPWELWTPLYPMPVSPIQQGNQGSRLDSSTKNDLNMGWKAAEGLQFNRKRNNNLKRDGERSWRLMGRPKHKIASHSCSCCWPCSWYFCLTSDHLHI